MSHRIRSKTVDSSDTRRAKTAAPPRRLTDKMAIIRKKEHEQSAEFEQAMQSIFEMQQARIHSGGGSMPSLQAIDNTPPPPTIDMESIFRDFDEMKRGSGHTMIEHNPPMRAPIARHTSMETDPYMPMGLNNTDHYWNASPEWLDGDLSRHKSDSDLQQSLMMQQQTSPHHMLPSQQMHRPHKMHPPGDLSLWTPKKRPNSATTHALLSPEHYIGAPDGLTLPPMGGSVGTASSLPDLTTIEFSSGLDVPLERDDPIQDKQYCNSFHQPLLAPMHLSPTTRIPGPSNLVYNSFQAPNNNFGFNPRHQYPSNSGVNTQAGYSHGPPLSLQSGISKSPTMPEFRNMHSTNGFVARFRPAPPPPSSHYKPILPSLPNNQSYPSFPAGFSGFLPQVGVLQGHTPPNVQPPPRMTIIIQPPPITATSMPQTTYQQSSPIMREPSRGLPPSFNIPPGTEVMSTDKSISTANQFLNGVSPLRSNNSIPTSYGLCLPSYTEAKMQQSLQQKFASINVGRNEAMIRSHSEENLQKIQRERSEVIQENPFMGTLANANSVPCVYVDSTNTEQYYDRGDSPPLDSPSTSASYASSPPSSVRPYWLEDEYMFREWPLENSTGAGGTNRPGSPLAHHRSLTDLSTIPEITELVSSNRSHQLSLPSVAMTDLTVDEQLDKGPSDYYLPHDFEMEEAVMDSLLKNGVPDLHPYDISMLAGVNAGDVLLSSSPESFLRTEFH